jgi:hypothetical protein
MKLIISGSPALAANCLVVRCPAFIFTVAISSLHAHHLMGRIKDRAEVSVFGLARQVQACNFYFSSRRAPDFLL